MALPATIHKASLQIADIDRGVYETLQVTAARHPSETEERLVARLLALAIFHEPELTFTKGLSAVDEPDIWVKGGDGRVLLWVEVGLPEAERIIKASRHAERVALLACGKMLASWDQQQLPKLAQLNNLTVVSVEQTLISTLAGELQRSISWSITLTAGSLYLTSGATTYESAVLLKTVMGSSGAH
jgi:uncharacterized protein YaeQ